MLRDWTNSDKVNAISIQSEVFFTRLIMKVDDYGCFWADSKRLKSNLFPLRSDSIRDADILRWMAECQNAGLIAIYDSDQKSYLQILDFGQRLRTKKSKFPLPDSNMRTNDSHLTATCHPEERIEIEIEVEEEVEEKEIPHTNFSEKNVDFTKNKKKEKDSSPGAEILYSIEHCITVAMNDDVWVNSNKASPEKLAVFNAHLSGQGIYEKNPKDYKQHFYHWNKKQKNGTHQQSNGQPASSKPGTSSNRTQALKDW